MVCIYCRGNLAVINSRPQLRTNQTWRRRKCLHCGAVFTSVEAIDLAKALSVSSKGELHAFSRDKLFISIYESCRHRPAANKDAGGLTDTIISKLVSASTDGLVGGATIINTASEVLKRFDTAAAIQYGAFHPIN